MTLLYNRYNSVFVIIIGHPVPYIEFIMTQYSSHKENDDEWYSPPFYTGPGGYKMCIEVDSNVGMMVLVLMCPCLCIS